jgi:hypothetical protein
VIRILALGELAHFLVEGGGTVGGGMALLGGGAFLAASIGRDFGFDIDVRRWTEEGTGLGAAVGFTALILDAVGVH